MKKMGFMKYESSPENERELFSPLFFEKQLSLQTSLIVEGEKGGSGDRYEYSFYKIKYVYQTNTIKEIKLYLSGGSEEYMIRRVFDYLSFCRILSDEVASEIRTKVKKDYFKSKNNYSQGLIK